MGDLMAQQGPPSPQATPSPLASFYGSAMAPIFSQEGPALYQQALQHNAPFATGGSYNTDLTPDQETQYRQWVAAKGVPTDPNATTTDYDMRGFWKEQPAAATKWQQGQHFPDTYKTPYDTSFSGESKYAKPNTPFVWKGDNLVDTRTGQVIFGSQR